MPDRSVLPFVVRTYEVDAEGQVLPATLMRWFQEAAIFASAANGFDEARYRALGSTWFVRESHLEVLGRLSAGQTVEVHTWSAQLQRVTAFREYLARRPNGEVVALGEAEWVYVDRTTGRPRRIEGDPMSRFPSPGGFALEDRDWGASELCAEWTAQPLHRVEHEVLWSELDPARHANNAVYAGWVLDQIAAHGRTADDLPGPGTLRRMRLRFLRGARGGERLIWLLRRAGDGRWLQECVSGDGGRAVAKAIAEVS